MSRKIALIIGIRILVPIYNKKNRNSLKTKDRLYKLKVGYDDLCPLCGTSSETANHLFFDCHFSINCKNQIMSWLGFQHSRNSVAILLKHIQRYAKSKVQKTVMYTAVACLVYHIWKARNSSVWRAQVPVIKNTVKIIQTEVKSRVANLLSKKICNRDKDWFSSL
ncbi:uncharacterized protein [Spinacia oleracea]|uniref:Reverse transcriptase zinc-binding domain-containing protein n=1 Tax=Spinacia oleracea TaxID=3562 RepID=A0ABM3QZA4_SPIOL|nr:uncharacterized protein LOC130463561 [Spinacia oleracea]